MVGSRFVTLAGSLLMFYVGLANIWEAYAEGLPLHGDDDAALGAEAAIGVIEALDRFLIAIVPLYFAYGVHSLFLHPEQGPEEARDEMAVPSWLRVQQIGQLKQVVAEVIIVVLFVLFLRLALQAFSAGPAALEPEVLATLLLLPLCTLLLAGALRLAQLHPKPVPEVDDGPLDGVPPD